MLCKREETIFTFLIYSEEKINLNKKNSEIKTKEALEMSKQKSAKCRQKEGVFVKYENEFPRT